MAVPNRVAHGGGRDEEGGEGGGGGGVYSEGDKVRWHVGAGRSFGGMGTVRCQYLLQKRKRIRNKERKKEKKGRKKRKCIKPKMM